MNKKTRYSVFIISSVILTIGIYLTFRVGASVTQDTYYSKVLINPYTNTINQTIFNTLMCVFGLALGYCFNDVFQRVKIVFLAPFLSATAWMLTGHALVIFGIPYNAFSAVAAMILLLAAVIIIKKPKIKPEFNVDLLLIIFVYLSLSLLFSVLDYNKFTPDTMDYMIIGTSLAENGGMVAGGTLLYSSRLLLTSFMFTPSNFFAFDYENGLYTLYGLSFNLSLCSFIFVDLSQKLSKKKAFAVSALAFVTLAFASLYSLLAHFYPMSNSIATASMFMAVYFAYEASKGDNKQLVWSAIFMISFIFSRSESIMIALIIMFFLSNMDFEKKHIVKYSLACFAALLLWYIRFFLTVGFSFDSGKFLTVSRASAVAAVFAMFIIYCIFIGKFKFYNKIKNKLDIAPYAAMILAMAAYMFIGPEKLLNNIKVTFENFIIYGEWGVTLIVITGLLSVYYFFAKKFDIWDKVLFAYTIGIVFIFLFRRTGLHIGPADSGNRLLSTIVPMAVFIVAYKLPPLLQKVK